MISLVVGIASFEVAEYPKPTDHLFWVPSIPWFLTQWSCWIQKPSSAFSPGTGCMEACSLTYIVDLGEGEGKS